MNVKYTKRTGAILSTAFALSFLSPGEVEAQTREDFLNVYTPPTNPTKLHLGSGDGNGDGWVDRDDYNMMVSEEENNMMMDLDLDSLQNTEEDREILAQYLRGDINSLPHQDMKLGTRAKKDDRLEKILRIDQTSKISPSPTWVSGDYGRLTSLNGMGYWDTNDPNIPDKYKEFSHLFGKLHTKIYYVAINFPIGPGHGAAGYFSMGDSSGSANDNPTKFEAWNFFEPRNDQINIQPGDWNMPYGSKVFVFGIEGFNESGGAILFPVVAFNIDSVGNDSLIYEAPGLVTERPIDETNPEISITYPSQDSTYRSLVSTFRYDLTEPNPRTCLYSTDDTTKIQTPCGEDIMGLQSKQGYNKWRLFAEDIFGNTAIDSVEFSVDTTTIGIGEGPKSIPLDFALRQNYPNPFNSRTEIEFQLLEGGYTSLVIYDIMGREVTKLIEMEMPSGWHKIQWNAKDVSSGVYLYKLKAGDYIETKKMVYLR